MRDREGARDLVFQQDEVEDKSLCSSKIESNSQQLMRPGKIDMRSHVHAMSRGVAAFGANNFAAHAAQRHAYARTVSHCRGCCSKHISMWLLQ